MGKKKKGLSLTGKILLWIVTLVVLTGLGAFLYLNHKKNDITKELLGKVNELVEGNIEVRSVSITSLFDYPILELKVYDVMITAPRRSMKDSLSRVIVAPEVRLRTDISNLLSKEIRIHSVQINDPLLQITIDSLGDVLISETFQPVIKEVNEKKTDSVSLSVIIDTVAISNLHVDIIREGNERYLPFSVRHLYGNFRLDDEGINGVAHLNIDPIDLPETKKVFLDSMPLTADLSYAIDLDKDQLKIKARKFAIDTEQYWFTYDLDFAQKAKMTFSMESQKEGIALESLFVEQDTLDGGNQFVIYGDGHVKAGFDWDAARTGSFLESMNATFSLEGRDLKIEGVDLDNFIDKFKRSQNFNLADVGAVMLAGPAGLAVTKGGDYASLAFSKKGDSTFIHHFVADWSFRKGTLNADDVALSTLKHRVASDGWYKIQKDSLDFMIRIVDKRGCELVGQRVYGLSSEPKYSRVKLIKTFLGPVKNFFRDLGFGCEEVYQGKVEHPEEG